MTKLKKPLRISEEVANNISDLKNKVLMVREQLLYIQHFHYTVSSEKVRKGFLGLRSEWVTVYDLIEIEVCCWHMDDRYWGILTDDGATHLITFRNLKYMRNKFEQLKEALAGIGMAVEVKKINPVEEYTMQNLRDDAENIYNLQELKIDKEAFITGFSEGSFHGVKLKEDGRV